MDPTVSDHVVKVEPESDLFEAEDDLFSPIITVTHPLVKVEPTPDPLDHEMEDVSSIVAVSDAEPAEVGKPSLDSQDHEMEDVSSDAAVVDADPVKAEPGLDHHDNKAESNMTSPAPAGAAPAADPVIKAEEEADNALVIKLDAPQTVRVLNMGRTKDKRLLRMQEQGRNILTLCRISRRNTPGQAQEMANRFADAELYLDWLETSLEMTPHIRLVTKVDLVLENLMDPKNHIPEKLANKAQTLYSGYKAENWGEDTVVEDDTETPTAVAQPASPSAGRAEIGEVALPSPNDPIFGINGIMHGILIDTTGKMRAYRLRPDIPRRSAKVYGHNGLALGSWFPLQINALFWGAHGARMAGIAGSVTTGAWSIVVASAYEDLDSDLGETLYYSGSNSHTNEDPTKSAPASTGTKALHASLATGNPVRVLRSGGNGSNGRQSRFPIGPRNPHQNRYLPSCGLRYDGLYKVTEYRRRVNKKNGLYDQFKLERLPGQTPLQELQRSSPTADQVNALDRLRGKA